MVIKLLNIGVIALTFQMFLLPSPLLAKKRISYRTKYQSLLKENKDLKKQNKKMNKTINFLKRENDSLKMQIDSLENQLNSAQREINNLKIRVNNLSKSGKSNKNLEKLLAILKLLIVILLILVLINIIISLAIAIRKNNNTGETNGNRIGMDDLRKILAMSQNIRNLNERLSKLDVISTKLDEVKTYLDRTNSEIGKVFQKLNITGNISKLEPDRYAQIQRKIDNISTGIRQLIIQIHELNSKLSTVSIDENHENKVFENKRIVENNSFITKTGNTIKSSSRDYFTSLTEETKEISGVNELRKITEKWEKMSIDERRKIFREMLEKGVYLLDPQLEVDDNVIEISNFVQNILTRKFKIDDINRFFKVKSGSDYIKKTIKPAILRRVDNEYILKETGELS